ncbi:hypothetical protein BZG36_02142 [Bifiguratus adelaidae]|uniref:t-SNARE coiled-coil homology domain-containing protein n=1 Tax=Bifiguratus adelaidae TaxID=1938954 RepID=A0A261Y342_9FUNG|nr:hypothetical protein BZG36_02142 [Bifiguratus adelaidae]
MATRSRTLLFLQYRNSYTSSHKPLNESQGFYDDSESTGLIESSDHVIELSVLPPQWVDVTEDVEEDISRIKDLIERLDEKHKKHLLPGFDDQSSDEAAIQQLTDDITHQFHATQRKIQKIQSKASYSDSPVRQEDLISRNIQTSLATKLQEVSMGFRKKQSAYLQKIKSRDARKSDVLGLEEGAARNHDLTQDDLNLGFTDAQLALIEANENAIATRESEINDIARSIYELAEIFKELETLVIDQGTMLDRIDYNIEQMRTNVKQAVVELDQGAKYQSRTRKRKLMLLLILIIMLLIVILIFKPKRH